MPKLFITIKADAISRNYNMQAVAFIKDVIKSIDAKRYEELYYYNDNGVVRANKKPKPFCVGVKPYYYLKPKEEMKKQRDSNEKLFEIDRDLMKLKDGMFTIIVSSTDKKFLEEIMEQIKNNKEKYKTMYGWEIEYDPVMPADKQEIYIRKNRIKIDTITPIVVTDKEGQLIDIQKEPDKFNDSLNYIMNHIFLATFGRGLKIPVKLIPVKYKIQKNKLAIDNYSGTIKGYYGRFILEGDREDINYMISLGIGFRRSQGYGMITLAPSEKIQLQMNKKRGTFGRRNSFTKQKNKKVK
jgi:CRISPR-associated endoribonuclease Cas6